MSEGRGFRTSCGQEKTKSTTPIKVKQQKHVILVTYGSLGMHEMKDQLTSSQECIVSTLMSGLQSMGFGSKGWHLQNAK